MTLRYEHPKGASPPPEWIQNGHVAAATFRGWLASEGTAPKRGKWHNLSGYYADLGGHRDSLLEANTERVIRTMGYAPWTGEEAPPTEGRFYRHEGARLKLTANAGREMERPVWYVPDFWLWDCGRLTIWESKGALDPRSKRILRLMKEQYPGLPVELITAEELEARAFLALAEARKRGEETHGIPHWNEGPQPKGE